MIQLELRDVNVLIEHNRMPYKDSAEAEVEWRMTRVLVFYDPTNNIAVRVPMPDDAWEATKANMDDRPQIVVAQPGDMPKAPA